MWDWRGVGGGGGYAVEKKGQELLEKGQNSGKPAAAAGALGVLSTLNAEVGVGPQCSWKERPGWG